jgi:hypothetical protein
MLTRTIAAVTFFAALSIHPALAADFTFAALGDTPYTRDEEARFPDLIAELNRQKLAFVVHVGDFKSADTPCTDELFLQRRDWFSYSHHPFVFVPGDNEWTDCTRLRAGRYDALLRLARLREIFFADEHSLGQIRLVLDRQHGYVEHSRWRQEGVLFVTLNVPGPNNHARAHPQEFRVRSAALIEWLDQSFELARRERLKGVVILMQANPWVSPTGHYFGFRELLAAFASQTRRFPGEVLLVHGDTHRYRVDKPLRDLATRAPVSNFTRVEVFGYPTMNWVRIRVSEESGRVRFHVTPGS